MEAECIAQTGDGDRLLGFCKDGERVLRHILLHGRREDTLQSPYARIVIGGIVFVVLGISLVEVELALGRVIQTVLLCELDEVLRCDIVLLVVGIVLAETALVTRHEVLVVRHTASQETVSAAVLEIPGLLAVDESDAEALGGTVFLDQSTETLHALACRVDIRQHDVVGAVLGESILDVWVKLQRFGTAEDRLRAALADAQRVEACASPLVMILVVGQSRVAQTFLRQRAAEATIVSDKLLGTVVGVGEDQPVLTAHGVEILGTGVDV